MKAVVTGESSGATMERIMSVYPRHKAIPPVARLCRVTTNLSGFATLQQMLILPHVRTKKGKYR